MVVILDIFFENAAKVVFIQNQDMVETILSDRAHLAFWYPTCFRGLIGGVNNFDATASQCPV